MYIEHLQIQNLKLLRDFKLDFVNADGEPRQWTVIIGPNGTGKTSILQAIALAAAGSLQVNSLARPVISHLVDRRQDSPMFIGAEFSFSRHASRAHLHPFIDRDLEPGEVLHSGLVLPRNQSTIRGNSDYYNQTTVEPLTRQTVEDTTVSFHDPLDQARSINRSFWFVAGYGVGRFLPEPQASPRLDQPSIERLEPLFRNTTLTSLAFHRVLPEDKAKQYALLLTKVLTNVEEIVPGLVGVELHGRNGGTSPPSERERFVLQLGPETHAMPALALSHGYQSTLAWIADLLGHVILVADEPVETEAIEGLVLIDEIDLYLHPRWQAGLIPALRKTFPKLQFVVTTHSPVALSSLEPEEIVVVDQDPATGHVERFVHDHDTGEFVPLRRGTEPPPAPDPRTMTGGDIYRTWFGLERLTLYPHGELLRQYMMLATDPQRTDEEERELTELRAKLRALNVEHRDPVDRSGS